MDESASSDAAQPVEPGADDGQRSDKRDSKVFDEAYVKSLRREAADNRKQLEAATARLSELEDRDRSEVEKAQRKLDDAIKRVAEAESRAFAAEAYVIRQAVAVDRKLKTSALPLLHGTTREEIEASADALAAAFADIEKQPPGFDGGARTTPPDPKSPDQAHNDFLLSILGRDPSR